MSLLAMSVRPFVCHAVCPSFVDLFIWNTVIPYLIYMIGLCIFTSRTIIGRKTGTSTPRVHLIDFIDVRIEILC